MAENFPHLMKDINIQLKMLGEPQQVADDLSRFIESRYYWWISQLYLISIYHWNWLGAKPRVSWKEVPLIFISRPGGIPEKQNLSYVRCLHTNPAVRQVLKVRCWDHTSASLGSFLESHHRPDRSESAPTRPPDPNSSLRSTSYLLLLSCN